MQIPNFSKIQSKVFECFDNIASFSCRRCQTFLSDMQIINLAFMIKEEWAFNASATFFENSV